MHIDPALLASYISACVAFASLIFVIISFGRTSRKDATDTLHKEDDRFNSVKENMIKINVKLDTLCGTANETRSDVKTINNELTQMQNHVTAIDERLYSMERRIHNLEVNVFDKAPDM